MICCDLYYNLAVVKSIDLYFSVLNFLLVCEAGMYLSIMDHIQGLYMVNA